MKPWRSTTSGIFSKSGLMKIAIAYFALIGLALHVLLFGVSVLKPSLIWALENKVMSVVEDRAKAYGWGDFLYEAPVSLSASELPLPAWKPQSGATVAPSEIRVGARSFNTLVEAAKALRSGDTLEIGPGVYAEALVIKPNGVTLLGQGHVVLDGKAANGKGAIIIKGDDATVRNIECRNIRVADGNGACIRQEGRNLNVEHVYFHDSQEGILTGANPGFVRISESRFEKLGYQGQAHGIYIGGGHLLVEDSQFIRSVSQGHEIKSRSKSTRITRSIVAALDGDDSRLIDLPSGGEITIERSILQQGPNSVNYNLIGVGLEGRLHEKQRLVVKNNTIIMERTSGNRLLQIAEYLPPAELSGNVVISADNPKLDGENVYFRNRAKAGLGPFPELPRLPD